MYARQTTTVVLWLMASGAAFSQPIQTEIIVTEGTDTVPACASCHGEAGEGMADMGAPMLAGLNADYMTAALAGFADGTRPGDTMSAIAPELTPEQMAALSAHYAALPASPQDWPAPVDDDDQPITPDLAYGESIFRHGQWANDVPPCTTCHGQNAEGIGATFPRIAGQLPDYMTARMEQIAGDDEDTTHPDKALMAAIARNLPADARAAVLAYVATLDPAAGPVTSYEQVALDWDRPTLPDAPLGDSIDWEPAQAAYDKQQKRLADPAVYTHTPPSFDSIPEGPDGDMIRFGRDLFTNTQKLRGTYVGNDLSCANCHMNEGANPLAAPVWATVVDFPKYRSKNRHVNTAYERIAGCFTYSMNGTPPAPQSKVAVGMEAYMKWLATGAPSGAVQKARGYVYLPVPEPRPDYDRGKAIYAARCATCHGADGQGLKQGDRVVFPPLWGDQSFNWGAGLHDLEKAAGFIRHNMPLGNADLTDAEAWDVALFMNSHNRPQDPRWLGSVQDTRRFFHRSTNTYGLQTANGLMGDVGAPKDKPAGIPAAESSAPKPPALAREQMAKPAN